MLFENNDFDMNMSIFMPDVKFNRDTFILDPTEGFLRGNMFQNEYVPYRNLTYYKLNPRTEREKLLYRIMALSFAINDLNLYLDLHPDDKEAFTKFKKFIEEEKELSKEFDKNYGPLTITKTTSNKYNWLDSPWPWDNIGGSMYV